MEYDYKIITATYDHVIYAGRWRVASGSLSVEYKGRVVTVWAPHRKPIGLARMLLAELIEANPHAYFYVKPQRGIRACWI